MTSSRDEPNREPTARGPLAHHIRAHATWTDVALDDAQLSALQTFCRTRAADAADSDVARRSTADRGVAILFEGATSASRALVAEVVARELQLSLYRVDLSAVVSKYIGETEKNLRRLFDAAEHGTALLFFDEADALFGKRTDVHDTHDRDAALDVDRLLQQIEAHADVAILATNSYPTIDPHVLRRFRLRVTLPLPPKPSPR